MTTYHSQCHGQMEQFHRTIVSGLLHDIPDHTKDWNLYTNALNYAHNTEVHRITNRSHVEPVLSKLPAVF